MCIQLNFQDGEQMYKKAIVITSIFSPTEAVKAFSQLSDYKVIVVGDEKSPTDWKCKNVEYISLIQQEIIGFELAKALPYNHYCRKMLGYLKAVQSGVECIVDTDDDNIPKNNYRFPPFDQEYDCISENKGFVNIYQLYTKQKIWPRGLPLNLIASRFDLEKYLSKKNCRVGIWQGLADGEPDVDALYRLIIGEACYFNEREPIVLGKGTMCPFNTQNTIIRRELFALMYLPTTVTFRFTDILRGLIAQPIMWLYDYQLGFINATVVQKRNPHDYLKDFISEIPMYQHCKKVVEIVLNAISKSNNIFSNLYNSYYSLSKAGIISDKELMTLEAWLKDLQSC
jgi:hypothetical protein